MHNGVGMKFHEVTFRAGVVEGFYGRPWTARQRRQLFGWMRDAGLNTYLYAPKDDLKHRAAWREPYDEGQMAELGALIHDCQCHQLEFVYALAPGLDLRHADANDAAALREKADQLRAAGCWHFALLFDDIPGELNPQDRQRFGTPARAQAAVANQLAQAVHERTPEAQFLFCPTEYCGRMARPTVAASPYLNELGEALAPDILVLWTGTEIVSETIPVESIQELQRVLRRKPVIWDNLHANDYDMRRLHLGPYAGRPPELRAEVAGILTNPNCQFEANFVAVRTLGAYLHAMADWQPREAYTEALSAWLPAFACHGRQVVTLEDLELLGDLYYLPFALGARAEAHLAAFTNLLRRPPPAWGGGDAAFEQTSREIVSLYDKLTALHDRDLLHSFYAHLWGAKELALLLLGWVRWRRSQPTPPPPFSPPEFDPGLLRGSLPAQIERLLPMDHQGRFSPAGSGGPPNPPGVADLRTGGSIRS
jgi:protein O-GlcNAcase/histone acetyltransferase